MSTRALIYVIEQNAHILQRLRKAAEPLGCCVEVSRDARGSLEEVIRLSPDLLIYGGCDSEQHAFAFLRRVRAEARLDHCTLVLMRDQVPVSIQWAASGTDELLLCSAIPFEMTTRLHAGLLLAQLRRQSAAAKKELDSYKYQKEREGDYLNDATAYLVEIAAELQAEVCQSAQREEESVRAAEGNTIAQTAATLRHEINNPLFAITASAEFALKRLLFLQAHYPENEHEFQELIKSVERIQQGSDRIQHVVQAISETLEATRKDYVEGVSMLALSKSN